MNTSTVETHHSILWIGFQVKEAAIEEAVGEYNVTACCAEAGLSDMCMPICSFDASMSKLKALGGVCASEFSKLLRCGAGGRNHRGCCSRRGVPPACLPLCSGVIVESVIVTVSVCVPYIGNIVQCFEEGALTITFWTWTGKVRTIKICKKYRLPLFALMVFILR